MGTSENQPQTSRPDQAKEGFYFSRAGEDLG